MSKYVEVITSLPIDRTFQYRVTGSESSAPETGKRVYIPFRGQKRVGYIVELQDEPVVAGPKSLIDVIDEEPLFTREMMALAKWMKDYYLCSWGEALEAMIPGALKRGKVSMVSRVKEEEETPLPTEPHKPNREQQRVLADIGRCLDEGRHQIFLLHGITGSGKTEIYLQAMNYVLAKGRSGIVLVPEISLTPQTVERFISRFGKKSRGIPFENASERQVQGMEKDQGRGGANSGRAPFSRFQPFSGSGDIYRGRRA